MHIPLVEIQIKDLLTDIRRYLSEDCRQRPVQYLNNALEQDHRATKRRVNEDCRQRPVQYLNNALDAGPPRH
jgi:transposase-like protein